MRTAREAVGAALAFHGVTDEVRAERLIAEWNDYVGERIAKRTRPIAIENRVLEIEVASSAWLHELSLLRAQILAGLLERVGTPRLFDDLKFRIAGRSRERSLVRATAPQRLRPPAAQKPAVPPASGLEREQILRETEQIDDDELRELIARVRISNNK